MSMQSTSSNPELTPRLVGDIGGTNARFALLDRDGMPTVSSTLRADDFSSPAEAIRTYLQEHDLDHVDMAAIAVATPVTGDQVKLTNNHWAFSIDATRKELGLDRLHVVNDFTALALSVPHLPAAELVKVGGGMPLAHHAMAILGPGTGLGVSGLVACGNQWTALEGEGGHVSVAVVLPRELAVFERLAERFRHVSAERFLSGPGLCNIVEALQAIDGQEVQRHSPADITRLALAGEDEHCVEALEMFARMLGRCAGNLALTLGAEGGVYIGGGIVPRLGEWFEHSAFREEFEAKGRMRAYLESMPTYVIHSPYPALVGVAQLLL